MATLSLGQRYTFTAENISVPTSPSSFDIFQLATTAAVPILVDRIVATANATSAAIQRVQLLRRTSASTGGSAVTARPTNGGSAAAVTTGATLLTTTTGTAGDAIDSQEWNEFAPYEFNQRPEGIVVPVSSWLSLFLPAAPGSGYSVSITVEFVELK